MPTIAFDCLPPYKYSSWDGFETDLATLARLGYHGIEISAGDPARLDVTRLGRSLGKHGLALSGILTGDSYDEERLCLTTPDDSVRKRAVARLKAHVDWIAPFGGVIVIGRMQGLDSDEPDRGRANARLVACLREVAHHAEATGVRLVFEACNRFEVNHNHMAAEVLEVIDQVHSPALAVLLDTFHMNIEEGPLADTVRLVGSRLGYVHVSDNNRGLIGSGHLDMAHILRATLEAGYQGYWVLLDFAQASFEKRAGAAMDYIRRSHLLPLAPRLGGRTDV